MLSSVLNSETAIDVNIQMIRIFTRMRELLLKTKKTNLPPKIKKSHLSRDGLYKNLKSSPYLAAAAAFPAAFAAPALAAATGAAVPMVFTFLASFLFRFAALFL